MRERLDAVLAGAARLTPGQRHVLVRHAVDGARHDVIAAELEITEGTSKNLLHRARRSLGAPGVVRRSPRA